MITDTDPFYTGVWTYVFVLLLNLCLLLYLRHLFQSILLFSLVGSWGPLLLPLPWLSFKLWWRVRHRISLVHAEYGTVLGDTVIDYYHSVNDKIWTPWSARQGISDCCLFIHISNISVLVLT